MIALILEYTLLLAMLTSSQTVVSDYPPSEDIMYSGLPPWGDSYFTAKISCGEIDGKKGEELVITDDFGSFIILGWDEVNDTFYEKWISDPVFTSYKISKIWIVSETDQVETYIIFSDSANNLKIFKWDNYILREDISLKLKKAPAFKSYPSFSFGKFTHRFNGWQIASITSNVVSFSKYSMPFFFVKTGYFHNGFRPMKTFILPNIHNVNYMMVIKGFKYENDGLIAISQYDEKGLKFIATRIYPFEEVYEQLPITLSKPAKFGWCGTITNGGDVYLTSHQKDENYPGRILFYNIEDEAALEFEVNLQSSLSSWELADIDNDGFRELITLDFMGNFDVYNLRNKIKGN